MSNIRFLRHRVITARDTLGWLIEHADPAIWPQAIREVRATQVELSRLRAEQGLGPSEFPRGPDGGIVVNDPFRCLTHSLNDLREKRQPTPREEAELWALVSEVHEPGGSRDEVFARALADPEWTLFSYRKLVARLAAPRGPR